MPSGSDKEYLACDILPLRSTATIRLALSNSCRYCVSFFLDPGGSVMRSWLNWVGPCWSWVRDRECPFALNARDTTILVSPSGRKPWER